MRLVWISEGNILVRTHFWSNSLYAYICLFIHYKFKKLCFFCIFKWLISQKLLGWSVSKLERTNAWGTEKEATCYFVRVYRNSSFVATILQQCTNFKKSTFRKSTFFAKSVYGYTMFNLHFRSEAVYSELVNMFCSFILLWWNFFNVC